MLSQKNYSFELEPGEYGVIYASLWISFFDIKPSDFVYFRFFVSVRVLDLVSNRKNLHNLISVFVTGQLLPAVCVIFRNRNTAMIFFLIR